jgi:hypothetical protein
MRFVSAGYRTVPSWLQYGCSTSTVFSLCWDEAVCVGQGVYEASVGTRDNLNGGCPVGGGHQPCCLICDLSTLLAGAFSQSSTKRRHVSLD